MFHTKDGLKLTPCALLVHIMLLILPPHCCCQGTPQVIGSPQPIVAKVGDDIILPCHLKPAVDASSQTVEWTRQDLNPRFVHVRRSGEELLDEQHPSFVGRTSLFPEELKYGNVSLHLSNVKLSDRGTYRCYIPIMNRDSNVELLVGSVSSPDIDISKAGKGVLFACKSEGWYPQPEVLWLDGEGNLLPAGSPETVSGPDGLYTVSSNVTVEKRDRNGLTCRVQQMNISQTREARIHVPAELFMAQTSLALRIIILTAVWCLSVAVMVLVSWKRKPNNRSEVDGCEPRIKTEEETIGEKCPRVTEEEQYRMNHTTGNQKINRTDKPEGNLKKIKQELEDVQWMITQLMDQKEYLMIQKEKLNSLQEDTIKLLGKNDYKKYWTYNFQYEKKNKLENYEKDLKRSADDINELIKNTDTQLEATNAMTNKMEKRKKKLQEDRDKILKNMTDTRRNIAETKIPRESEQSESEDESL